MISVIIPAHNEAAVIGRCLDALTKSAGHDEIEIVVVCNGCSDRTAEVAREFEDNVRVVETPVASKVHALNLGDAAARCFPRFYLDADVVVTGTDLRRMATELDSGNAPAIAPLPKFDVDGCSWFVRAYYDIHQRLPAYLEGIGGSGVYGLSETGRRRFDRFPEVTADDGFVRLQFAVHERRTLQECRSTVVAPGNLRELIAIKARSYSGTMELQRRYPQLFAANLGKANKAALRGLMIRPWLWPQLGAYTWVKLMARRRARKTRADGRRLWERDESSRARDPEEHGEEHRSRDSREKPPRRRVLAVASGGGHWVQLLRTRPAFMDQDLALVTVDRAYESDAAGARFYTINDATRWNKFGLVRMCLRLVAIMIRERPDVVISTGAAPGYFALRIGKLMGSRTIWLDSMANVERLSLAGQRVGKYADLWLTQWEHLAAPDGPTYAGGVL